jgi:hypothetical protein
MYTTDKPDKPLYVLNTLYDLTKEGRHNISNSDIKKHTNIQGIQDIQGEELYDILKILLEQGLLVKYFLLKV